MLQARSELEEGEILQSLRQWISSLRMFATFPAFFVEEEGVAANSRLFLIDMLSSASDAYSKITHTKVTDSMTDNKANWRRQWGFELDQYQLDFCIHVSASKASQLLA